MEAAYFSSQNGPAIQLSLKGFGANATAKHTGQTAEGIHLPSTEHRFNLEH